jgi:hypothetical protein
MISPYEEMSKEELSKIDPRELKGEDKKNYYRALTNKR